MLMGKKRHSSLDQCQMLFSMPKFKVTFFSHIERYMSEDFFFVFFMLKLLCFC